MDSFSKFFVGYLIFVTAVCFLEEPAVGIAFATWILIAILLTQNEDNFILATLWWFLGMIPSIYIAMFIVDLFN